MGHETHGLGVWPGSGSERGGWDGPPDRALARLLFALHSHSLLRGVAEITPVPMLKGFKVHDMPKVEKALTDVPHMSLLDRNLRDRDPAVLKDMLCVSGSWNRLSWGQ